MYKQLYNKRVLKVMALSIVHLSLSISVAMAQPSWVKKATKSVFTLKTFAADGSLIASSNGFFTGQNGEAVSSFSPFKGAARAIVIDAQGKETAVENILGANDIYDVARFRVASNKTQPLPLCTTTMPEGSTVWLLPYHETKQLYSGPIRKAEKFMGDYDYYTVAITSPQHVENCPLLNESGEVIGLIQPSANAADSLSYAISVVFADSLHMTGFSINEPVFQQTQVKKALPSDIKEANVALFLASSKNDSLAYAELVDDMISQFPAAPDGYTYKAQLAAAGGDFVTADQFMNDAIRVSDPKDEAHYNFARLIYNKAVYQSAIPYDSWSLDKALSEIRQSIAISPLPSYQQLEAEILFAQKEYDAAYDIFIRLSQSSMRSAEIFYSAAKCKAQLRDTTAMLSLLDSCVNTFSKPYFKEAAPYLWERAEARRDAGKYRDAIADMNEYEKLMSAEINESFYYIRHQTHIQARLYQQALNDINRAIQMNPNETLYYAEKASLEIRVGLYDDAIATAQECIAVDPKASDGYLFLGLAQCLKDNKKEGIENLRKAKELGDPQADALIEKYSK
jgi:tetratricopeptide (TPR) repeat protein